MRREQILDAALRVYDRGFAGDVTYDEIAAEAGVSRPLVYVYFPDRQALALAMAERAATALQAAFARVGSNPTELSALTATRVFMEFARDNPITFRQLAGLAQHASRPVVRRIHDRLLTRAIQELGGDGEARLIAYGIAGLLRGATAYWLTHPDVDLEHAAGIVAEVMELVLDRRRRAPGLRRSAVRR
ncbi:MAG: TetR/AcrR family transcriptional regulator [Candidatus Binatia bacterium]